MQKRARKQREELGRLPQAPINPLQRAAEAVSNWSAGSWGTGAGVLVVIAWVAAGAFLSSGWDVGDRLITGISFLLLFLLQRAQKKDTQAVQLKLNELLAALDRASPKLINIEDESEEEVEALHERFQDVQAQGGGSHSIDDS
jgi:low affinity Fe/Cu permease